MKKSNRLVGLFFILIIFAVFNNVGIFKYLDWPPSGPHQWAQCDRGSAAKLFSEESLNIFLPHTHNIANGTGITGMEFPIINWLVGILYRLFGFQEIYYRLLMFIFYAVSIFFAFKMTLQFTNNNFSHSLLAVLIFSLSPVLCFYSANFIPDIASMALAIGGWYLFLTADLKRTKPWISITILLSLASLIKITALIHLFTMAAVFVLDANFWNRELKKHLKKMVFSAVATIAFPVAWYAYAIWLNDKYDAQVFLTEPKAAFGLNELAEVYSKMKKGVLKEYYVEEFKWVLIVLVIVPIYFYRRAEKRLLFTTLILYIGSGVYFILMARQFPDHDYYIITLLPAILFNLILFFNLLQKLPKPYYFTNWIIVGLLFVFSNYMMVYCKKNIRNRYTVSKWNNFLATDRLFNLEPEINKLGVTKDKTIIFYSDSTTNVSLYFLNRKGVPVIRENIGYIPQLVAQGRFNYLFINNPAYLSAKVLEPFLLRKEGVCNNISIYKLND